MMSSPITETCSDTVTSVDDAIEGRQSVRAFTDRPVERPLIRDILQVASRAPSGANMQPWKTYVLQGEVKAGLIDKVCAAHDAIRADPGLGAEYQESYDYYPRKWIDPFLARRRENGWGLYGLLGIERAEKDKMHAQHQRNFRFFDAPVGLMFTVHTILGQGALLDMGGFIQNIMVAARARGLDTCPQAAWNSYSKLILEHIGAGGDEMLVCGMALGYADTSDIVNTFRTPREPVDDFTVWLD